THGGLCVELVQYSIGAPASGEGSHTAIRIVKIAKHDGLRGTCLLARGLDRPVGERLSQTAGFYLALFDPLHAEGALLHHAARPDDHVRVEDEILEPILVRVIEPVEPPHLVWTVVGAVSGSDAAVIRLLV